MEIEHQHARGLIEQQRVRLVQIACLADDRKVGLGLQHHSQAIPHDRVVVGDDERKRGTARTL